MIFKRKLMPAKKRYGYYPKIVIADTL